MDELEQNTRSSDTGNESENTIYRSFNNLNTSQYPPLEQVSSNGDINDPVKYLDLQRMLMEQGNAMMLLKVSEYEKALTERDNTIKSLHTDMMNSRNNNHILNNQYKNIMEKTKSVSDTCMRLNSSFSNICDRLNRLGESVDNARGRQQDVITLVDQTISSFQVKILTISDNIDESLKQVNVEKMRAKQELEIMESRYSLDLITYRTKLEELNKEIEQFKAENGFILEKLNEANIELNKEKEVTRNLNQHYENKNMEIESHILHLTNENKSLSDKYDDILTKNKTLNDELCSLKSALDENKKQLDQQLSNVQDQTELLNNFNMTKELNESIAKENCCLKERYEQLEIVNTSLMNDINTYKLSQNEQKEQNEIQFKNMCKSYDELLKMQEEKISETTIKLEKQQEQESKFKNEVIDLKQQVETSAKTIEYLQEEVKTNSALIPELQNKIEVLNTDLANSYQNIRESAQNFVTEKNELEKEKMDLENQSKEHFKQIEKLTSNYMKYKSKAKQLYVEVMRLRFQCSRSEGKKSFQHPSGLETIEILSEEEENSVDNDVSIVEYNDQSVPNVDFSMQSVSNKMNQKSKRHFSPVTQNSKAKKIKTSIDPFHTTVVKQKTEDQQIVEFLNSSIKNININDELKQSNTIPETMGNLNVRKNSEQNDSLISIHSKEKQGLTNDNKKLITSTSNADTKKTFKIPSDIKPSQKKVKPVNVQTKDRMKPNSPVVLTPASPKSNLPYSKVIRK